MWSENSYVHALLFRHRSVGRNNFTFELFCREVVGRIIPEKIDDGTPLFPRNKDEKQ